MSLTTLQGLSTADMRRVEAETFSALSLSSRVVMESAGRAVVNEIVARYQEELQSGALVVCGPGNNGGDGYRAARLLKGLGVETQVFSICPVDMLRDDALASFQSWKQSGGTTLVDLPDGSSSSAKFLISPGVVVDAIFGIGLSRSLTEDVTSCVRWINTLSDLGAKIVAVDVPSGVQSDSGHALGDAVRADLTITFQALKFAHVSGFSNCGEVVVCDVGIRMPQQSSVTGAKSSAGVAPSNKSEPFRSFEVLDRARISFSAQKLLDASSVTHKGDKGHVLLIGGRTGQCGAIALSARAALRAGAGLVTVVGSDSGIFAALAPYPTIMAHHFDIAAGDAVERLQELVTSADAVVVGPGMGVDSVSKQLLQLLLKASLRQPPLPVVFDADALTLLALHPELSSGFHNETIATPHPGEAGRMLGCSTADVQADRLQSLEKLTKKFPGTIILKGAHSAISGSPVAISALDDSTLSTAGSGDVLSGILGAILGRGLSAGDAAAIAVFVHGACGYQLSHSSTAGFGATAEDILESIPTVLAKLSRSSKDASSIYFTSRSLRADEFHF